MNKELSPLEALERIGKLKVDGLRTKPAKTILSDYNDYHIIETALKSYERMLKVFDHKTVANTYKKLKSLELIQNHFKIAKPAGVSIEKNAVGVGGLIQIKDLTIEDYSLLKEVLL